MRLDAVTGATQVRLSGDPLTEGSYQVRVGPKPRYSSATQTAAVTGGAGGRDLFVTSASVDSPKDAALAVTASGATPATAFYRKIGEATWSGAVLTDLRLTHGVQASADQYNSFVFRSLLTTATPLTVRGLSGHSADLLRVEDSTQAALLRVTPTGVTVAGFTVTQQLQVPVGTASAPTYAFTADADTGVYSPGSNQVGLAAGGFSVLIASSSGGVNLPLSGPSAPLTLGSDVTLYRASAQRLEVGSNVSLNLAGGAGFLLLAGTAMNSTHLADSTSLVRSSGATFTGAVLGANGSAAAPGFGFAGDPDTGLYSFGPNSLGLTTGGTIALSVNGAGQVSVPAVGATGGVRIGSENLIYNGTGGAYLGSQPVTITANDLEVRKSNGPSRLILSRPDGTRVALRFNDQSQLIIESA